MVATFLTWLGITASGYPQQYFILQSVIGIFIIWECFQLLKFTVAVLTNMAKSFGR